MYASVAPGSRRLMAGSPVNQIGLPVPVERYDSASRHLMVIHRLVDCPSVVLVTTIPAFMFVLILILLISLHFRSFSINKDGKSDRWRVALALLADDDHPLLDTI
jgi:hypothetical protein